MRRHSEFFSSGEGSLVSLRSWGYRWRRNGITGGWAQFITETGAEYGISLHGKYHMIGLVERGVFSGQPLILCKRGEGWTLASLQLSLAIA